MGGTFLVVQWLRLCLPMQGMQVQSLQGNKIPHALWSENQNIKQKQYCNKFKKDFKNGLHQKEIFMEKKELCCSLNKDHRMLDLKDVRDNVVQTPYHLCQVLFSPITSIDFTDLLHYSHPSTNQAWLCLASEIRQDQACSKWHGLNSGDSIVHLQRLSTLSVSNFTHGVYSLHLLPTFQRKMLNKSEG